MIDVIGWTILHSIWQAGAVAALVAAVLFVLRGRAAHTRYLVSVIGLCAMTVLPIVTVQTRGPRAELARQTVAKSGVQAATKTAASLAAPSATTSSPSAGATTDTPAAISWRARLNSALPWIVALWSLGVLLFSLRTIVGYMWSRRLIRVGTRTVSDQLRGITARIGESLGVRVAVRVLESSRVRVPMVVGWLRPVILLPASIFTGLTPMQIEAILAHELAHIRRHDYLVNLLQIVVETLYFYHPAAWWLSARIREERENACDELAVAACGGDRVFYSRVLLTVEESRAETALAVAANGSSLSRRIHRLLGVSQSHLDIGPRWYAGVFTVALALLAFGDFAEHKLTAQPSHAWMITADTSKARPSSVTKYNGSAALPERWTWATAQADRSGSKRYWIGYIIDGNPRSGDWLHFDHIAPVSLNDNSVLMGGMRFNGDLEDVRISGVPVESVVGAYQPHQVVLLMAFERDQPVRLHVASFAFPMNFANLPLYWLGHATDRESIGVIAQLERSTKLPQLREDLTEAVGAHADADVAVPLLADWVQDARRSADLRREAVEALEVFDDARVLTLLANVARRDASEDVQAEAIESIGALELPGIADTLRAFALSFRNDRLQEEAIEALGDLDTPRSEEILRELLDRPELGADVRRQVIESLVNADAVTAQQLAQYATRQDAEDVQRQAVESLGQLSDERAAAAALRDIIRTHPSNDVRREAVEALGELKGAIPEIAEIALEGDLPNDVRRAAVEAYMNEAPEPDALAFARKLLTTDVPEDVRREAIDMLESMDSSGSIELLVDVIRTTSNNELRKSAVEALAESDNPRAIAALKNVR